MTIKNSFIQLCLLIISFLLIVNCNVKRANSDNNADQVETNHVELSPEQRDKELEKLLSAKVPQTFFDMREKAQKRRLKLYGIHPTSTTHINVQLGNYKEVNLNNNKDVYVIAHYTQQYSGILIIFKKEGNKLTQVWESKEHNLVFSLGYIDVKDIFHDGKKEIIIGGAASNSANDTIIYRWEGTSARYLGSFSSYFDCRSLAVKGGNKLPKDTTFNPDGDELVERGCSESRIYRWDGHDYKLFKVVKAVPGTPLYK